MQSKEEAVSKGQPLFMFLYTHFTIIDFLNYNIISVRIARFNFDYFKDSDGRPGHLTQGVMRRGAIALRMDWLPTTIKWVLIMYLHQTGIQK
jgi:hypothetical protein